MITTQEIYELARFLKLDQTETGDTCILILELWAVRWSLSEALTNSLDQELRDALDMYKSIYTIEDVEETRPVTYQELVEIE